MPGASSVTRTKCRYDHGIQIFYDGATGETMLAMAPMWYTEDFLGEDGLELGNTADRWEIVDVGAATEAMRADIATGVFRLHMAVTDEAEDAVLYWADQTPINVLNDVQFECVIDFAVLPTLGVTAVFGMCGDHNLDKDTTAESAWFRIQGTAGSALLVETDDATTDTNDTATGITVVAGTPAVYRIDFADLSDVKFYVDGARVAGGTTHDLSALTGTTGLMQPYFSLDKASSAGLGDMDIDKVSIWGTRSSYRDNS